MLTHNNSIDVNFLRTINTKSDQNFYCPTDLVLSLQHFNWKSLYNTLHKGLCVEFLMVPRQSNISHKDSKVIFHKIWPKRHFCSSTVLGRDHKKVLRWALVPSIKQFLPFKVLKAQNQVCGTVKVTFWPDFVLIVLKNWHLLSLCGLIFYLPGVIKRSPDNPW